MELPNVKFKYWAVNVHFTKGEAFSSGSVLQGLVSRLAQGQNIKIKVQTAK